MRVRRTLVAGARGLWLTGLSLVGSAALFCLTLVSLASLPLGLGWLTTPPLISLTRRYADQRRRWAHDWTGLRIPDDQRPLPDRQPGLSGHVQHCYQLLRDPATWRELGWLGVDLTAGCITALLPGVLIVLGIEGFVLPLLVWKGLVHDYEYVFLSVSDPVQVALMPVLGAAVLAASLFNTKLLRVHFRLAAAFLTPSKAELAARVTRLTETRHDAVDVSAAELRRIERDLHDGAQARLVAMGMDLGTIEALIERDPAKAKELVSRARTSSAQALTELRDLVRGIHPPVLAERGLDDAVRALALRMPLPVEVTGRLPGRLEAPVESAAYFSVSELLTNAVKHADAERVWVDLEYAEGRLRISVGDDGRGGVVLSADGTSGAAHGGAHSGLRGLERRLGTFDGILAVSSPVGGPTLVTLEIPCALCSPKTSSS
ncbi:histidine kinase [Streptomyces rimosus subsp. rimosus]|uniref:histidine kinase n=2 Tax=Streptomyces rimosus subsp. rimosus TaxID=132474 RepID=A0A8A1UKX7_STRR1|nr:sensor histidine kinase [Streptomyces rimosus]KOG84267.1 histidine kinase [Kitasatospora aureofaciens]KOT27857.1 histidine kinase [Streptomyces sp. NRRL WC-3701]KOT86348.1 histidine kinase [Streptomyces rimosus subsp. pseudoverticillatus]MYT46319.1 sensor histidine kinase [Streptomyces sp. SID5471]QGY70281.1 sensor histidine kinase [Streptomyces rimosus R6-500]RSO50111.1 sensor histidine kinase [Streptomyces sp. WAC 06725]